RACGQTRHRELEYASHEKLHEVEKAQPRSGPTEVRQMNLSNRNPQRLSRAVDAARALVSGPDQRLRDQHRDSGNTDRGQDDRSTRSEPSFVRPAHVFGLDMYVFARPDLVPATQQVKRRDGDYVVGGIVLDQRPFDLIDLRAHRSAERNSAGVVDVERNT